jgi:hypothetical protein
MYRIVAVTACAAVFAGLTFAAAPAATCDERIAGSCPIEPIVEQAEANPEPVAAQPLAYARAGKERSARRARRASRPLGSAERRRTAVTVARALAREREPRQNASPGQQMQLEKPRPEASAPPAANPEPPAEATILSPNFVQTIDLRRPRPEASSLVVADASAQLGAAAQVQTTAASEPAASDATSGQAAAEPPASAEVPATTADVTPTPSAPVQAAVSTSAGTVDSPWLRFAFLAFGGVLALGSAIRLFV